MTAEYAKIMERINRGNPPELQAKLDATKGAAARLKELQQSRSQGRHNNQGNSCGQ